MIVTYFFYPQSISSSVTMDNDDVEGLQVLLTMPRLARLVRDG